MSQAHEVLPRARFDELADRCLSQPLERDRALWRIELAPVLGDGTVGMVMKVHHAMVDGKSALELALLLLDMEPEGALPGDDDGWTPAVAPGGARLALEAITDVALTVVAGALRELSMRADHIPEAMKVMVPVSTRTADEAGRWATGSPSSSWSFRSTCTGRRSAWSRSSG